MANTTRRSFFRMVATTKNQTLYARNQEVWDEFGEPLPKVGQPVLFDAERNLSLDATDLPTTDRFELGVVILTERKEKKIVTVDGTEWDLCADRFKVDHTLPVCGCPDKYDFYFRCVQAWKGYSVAVRMRTPYSKMHYGGGGDHTLTFTYAKGKTTNWSCNDCDPHVLSAYEVACGLAREVAQYNDTDKEMEQVGRVNQGGQEFIPIKAVALPYGKPFLTLSLSPTSTSCNTCDTLPGFNTLTIQNGVADPIEIDLSRFNDEGTDPKIMLTHVYRFLERELAKHNVFVHVSGGQGCCPFEIEIGGCVTTATLNVGEGEDEEDLAFTSFDPWDEEDDTNFRFTDKKNCVACEETNNEYFPEAMIRFYTENITQECGCHSLPGDNMNLIEQENRILEVHGVEGFHPDQYGHQRAQKQKYAENSGYQFLLKLHEQTLGGRGAGIFEGGEFYGKYPQKVFNHKFYEAQYNIKCNVDYCSINMIATKGETQSPIQNAMPHTAEHESMLLIPNADIDTYDSLRPIFDYLASLARCNKLVGGCFVLPTSFVIDQGATESIAEAATVQLTVTETPTGASKAGVWSSATPAVATVSATGLVTGVSAGTSVVTFTPSHGTAVPVTITITVT